MFVQSIEPLDKRRSKVTLEGGLAFALYKGELKRYQIREQEDLPEEQYQELVETILKKRARERALYLLKASDKTEQELRRKLQEGWYPEPAIDAAIQMVKMYHYVDDENYAERYIVQHGERKSARQLCYELRQKGIPEMIIKQKLEESPPDEEKLALAYLRKKGYAEREMTREERNKAGAALARKGVSWECIRAVLDHRQEEWE